jgi:uncharacterized membrane protein
VTGTPTVGPTTPVTDTNPSHYFAAKPTIKVTKYTNGEDADTPTGPYIKVGTTVTWTYRITNTGNVTLTNIVLVDNREGSITCPVTLLAPGASTLCTETGVAQIGQYANTSVVTGTPTLGPVTPVTDTNPSHYYGPDPKIKLTKYTNGEDADTPTGPVVAVGSTVTWTYRITNTGNVTLTSLTLTDDKVGGITCPVTQLAPGATTLCTKTGTAVIGQYKNTAIVTGTPTVGPTTPVTDTNPSHYFAAKPTIKVTKYTNGEDADTPTGPYIKVGTTVTWTYRITNTGNVTLTNIVLADNREGSITCPVTLLAPGASTLCTETGVAQIGQYANTSVVTGTPTLGPVTPVTDTNPSHYYGPDPKIKLTKYTNGEDADTPTGPVVAVGSTVTWTYRITNTGNVTLTSLTLTDDKVGGITCPVTLLAPGATTLCTKTGTAVIGQYKNTAIVTGTPTVGPTTPVTDTNPSHYFAAKPTIKVTKYTNGEDADTPTGPYVKVGTTVTWTYRITNTGNVTLTNIVLVDNREGSITCPVTLLAPGASTLCTETGVAQIGQYANTSVVTGTPTLGPVTPVTDTNPSHYYGPDPKIKLTKYTNGQDADTPTGPVVAVGSTVTWTYRITNTGNVTLTSLTLTDDKVGGITCPVTLLAPGATTLCTKTGTAVIGQYKNTAIVTGTPTVGPTTPVTDTNPSHYFAAKPTIKVTKYTNGEDADALTGPVVKPGDTVTWTYRITNTGNVTLTNVTLVDDKQGAVTCPVTLLAPNASTLCTLTGTAVTGQYTNTALVTGTPTLGPVTPVTDTNPSHYFAPRFSLGNQVFADVNNNGLKDVSEGGLDGVTVRLLDASNNVLSTTNTAGGGFYRFDGLVAGQFKVEVVVPAGYVSSADIASSAAPDNNIDNDDNGVTAAAGAMRSGIITLGPSANEPTGESPNNGQGGPDNQGNMTVDFGFYRLELGNQVWDDTTYNGVKDSGEPGIDGVIVALVNPATGAVVSTTVTANGGYYTFTGFISGTYVVSVTAPLNYVSTLPDAGDPDADIDDNDDNGPGNGSGQIAALPVTMTPGSSTNGSTVNPSNGLTSNPRVDFGFFRPLGRSRSRQSLRQPCLCRRFDSLQCRGDQHQQRGHEQCAGARPAGRFQRDHCQPWLG